MPQEPTIPDLAARVRRLAEFLASEQSCPFVSNAPATRSNLRRAGARRHRGRVPQDAPAADEPAGPSLERSRPTWSASFGSAGRRRSRANLLEADRELAFIEALGIRNPRAQPRRRAHRDDREADGAARRIRAAAFRNRSRLKEERNHLQQSFDRQSRRDRTAHQSRMPRTRRADRCDLLRSRSRVAARAPSRRSVLRRARPGRALLPQYSEHHLDGADHRMRRDPSRATVFWPRTRASRRSAPITA